METDQNADGNQPFVAHVPVPSQKEVCSEGVVFLFTTYENSCRNNGRFLVVQEFV